MPILAPGIGPFGLPELLIIAFIIVLVFGVGRLPEVGGAVGKGIREFRKATKDEDPDAPADTIAMDTGAGAMAAPPVAGPPPSPSPVPPAPVSAAPTGSPATATPVAAPPVAAASDTAFCTECGARNPRAAKFCANCGNSMTVPAR
jgi:sec-independent protein translocase protein TatA